MKKKAGITPEQYSAAMNDYICGKGEVALQQGYELGRLAIGKGMGLMDVMNLHQDVFCALILITPIPEQAAAMIKGFEFFSELLSVFEMAQRSFQETVAVVSKINVELEKSVNEFKALNKELETFSYSVSHDLRAPLRSILEYSDTLLANYGPILGKGKEYLVSVIASTQRMTSLIDGLLELSKLSRNDLVKKPVNLSELVQEIFSELKTLEPSRQVQTIVPEGIVTEGDQQLLRAALDNLLRNAWKFTSKKQEAKIEFGFNDKDGETIYFVRDDGAGFDMRYAERLFGVFQRLHPDSQYEGTGIGLATVQRVVNRHGGRIWVEAQVGLGATFFFVLKKGE